MTLLALLLINIVFYAALGRSTIPKRERLPWWKWTFRDLVANVVKGIRTLITLHRQRWPLDAYLADVQGWHREPGSGPPQQVD